MENKRKICIAVIFALLFMIVATSCSNAASDVESEEYWVNGIDVAEHQGDISAQEVNAEFVVIRLGYSGYGSGKCVVDDFYNENVKKFTAKGTKIALYWASHAITLDEVKAENQFIIETYNSLSEEVRSKISYIFIDREKIPNPKYDKKKPSPDVPEYIGRADYLTNEQFNTVLSGQVHLLQELLPNMKIGVYTTVDYLVNMIDINKLGDVPIWIAWWNSSNLESFEPVINRTAEDSMEAATYLKKNIVMWQYSDKGNVAGILKTVDLNIVSSKMFE